MVSLALFRNVLWQVENKVKWQSQFYGILYIRITREKAVYATIDLNSGYSKPYLGMLQYQKISANKHI